MLVALIYRDPPGMPAGVAGELALKSLAARVGAGFDRGRIWGLFNVAYIVLISFAPELFTARGYSLAEASASSA